MRFIQLHATANNVGTGAFYMNGSPFLACDCQPSNVIVRVERFTAEVDSEKGQVRDIVHRNAINVSVSKSDRSQMFGLSLTNTIYREPCIRTCVVAFTVSHVEANFFLSSDRV